MRLGVLGPLLVHAGETGDAGRQAVIPRRRARTVLALLACAPNRPMSVDRLVDALWPDDPPRSAVGNLRVYVHELRQALGADRISSAAPGYTLHVRDDELDIGRFTALERQAIECERGGDRQRAVELLRSALKLWRGEPFLDCDDSPLLGAQAREWHEARLRVWQHCLDLELARGGHQQILAEVTGLVERYPLAEGFRAQLMLALYRCGRASDALAAFTDGRTASIEETGLEPGKRLCELQQAILRSDSSLDLPHAGDGRLVPAARPGQLPAVPGGFTGRTAALDELDGASAGLTVVTGPGGIGKTALAVQWAHRAKERFPDGQLFLDLRGYAATDPVPAGEALGRCLRALGVTAASIPANADEAAALWRSMAAGRALLLVLDNAADPEQVRPLLPGSPTCKVVVTSRNRMDGLVAREGADRIALSQLPRAESVSLLRVSLGDEDEAVLRELATACGHLPLALRIASAHLSAHPGHTVAGYLERLHERGAMDVLTVAGDQDTSMRVTFDMSYRRLATETAQMFRLLAGVPCADVSAGATAALAGTAQRQAQRLLDELSAVHLISEPVPGRYQFHDLVRAYAAERCARDEPEQSRHAAAGRLFDWYLTTCRAAARTAGFANSVLPGIDSDSTGPPPAMGSSANAMRFLEAEATNVALVIRHAAAGRRRRYAWLLVDALIDVINRRWDRSTWLPIVQAALHAAREARDRAGEAACELVLAVLAIRAHDYQSALSHSRRALQASEDLGLPRVRVAALSAFAGACHCHGDLVPAERSLREAYDITCAEDDQPGQSLVLFRRHAVLDHLGRPAEAIDCGTRAVDLARRLSMTMHQVMAMSNLASTYIDVGRFTDAVTLLTEALAKLGAGDDTSKQTIHCTYSAACLELGDREAALRHATLALTLATKMHSQAGMCSAHGRIGPAEHALGRPERAESELRTCLDLARSLDMPEKQVLAGLWLCRLRLAGAPAEALDYAREALRIATEHGYLLRRVECLVTKARTHLALDDAAQAGDCVRAALATKYLDESPLWHARSLRTLGDVLALQQRHEEAVRRWREAHRMLAELQIPEADEVRHLLADRTSSGTPGQKGGRGGRP